MNLVSPLSRIKLSPECIDGAITRAPLLLMVGLLGAILSVIWGGVGCIGLGALAWVAAQQLLLIDWRASIEARVRAALFLLATAFLVYLLFACLVREGRFAPLFDLIACCAILLAHSRFLISVMIGEGEGRSVDLPRIEEVCAPLPRHPGHAGVKPHHDGYSAHQPAPRPKPTPPD